MTLTLNNDLKNLKIGDYFYCKYTVTTAGMIGVFSDLAIKVDSDVSTQLIPVTSSATPNGYFRYIVVDFDHLGGVRCIADRYIASSISWDKINEQGMASTGREVTFAEYSEGLAFTIRSLTGGVSATDTDNEWNKYIVNSTLGDTIVAGDNNVWNWSGMQGFTSTTISGISANRVLRGYSTVGEFLSVPSSSATSVRGFRPVLIIESLFTQLNKSFLFNGEYKKWVKGVSAKEAVYSADIIPKMTSNTTPSGIASASSYLDVANDAWRAFAKSTTTNDVSWISSTADRNTAWVAYEFSGTKKIVKYSIQQGGAITAMPKDWSFEGWDGVSWIVIDQQVNQSNWTSLETRTYITNNTTLYKKYRISITSNNGSAAYANILAFGMMEEMTPATPPTFPYWQTIAAALPPVDTFKSDGMDKLSALDRKPTTFKDAMSPSGALGVGKVFKKTIDLKKLFEIANIKVE